MHNVFYKFIDRFVFFRNIVNVTLKVIVCSSQICLHYWKSVVAINESDKIKRNTPLCFTKNKI